MVTGETLPFTLSALILTYFSCQPHHLTPRGLDIANVVLAVMWICMTIGLTLVVEVDQGSFHYHLAWYIFARTLQGIFLGNARLTSMLHVIWVFSDIYIFSLIPDLTYETLLMSLD